MGVPPLGLDAEDVPSIDFSNLVCVSLDFCVNQLVLLNSVETLSSFLALSSSDDPPDLSRSMDRIRVLHDAAQETVSLNLPSRIFLQTSKKEPSVSFSSFLFLRRRLSSLPHYVSCSLFLSS